MAKVNSNGSTDVSVQENEITFISFPHVCDPKVTFITRQSWIELLPESQENATDAAGNYVITDTYHCDSEEFCLNWGQICGSDIQTEIESD